MGTIKKQIPIEFYLSKVNHKCQINHYVNGSWITPSETQYGWGGIFSDIDIMAVSSFLPLNSPLKNLSYLSYRDIKRIKIILDDFQLFIKDYVINNCNYQNYNTDLYNKNYQKYLLYGGTQMLLFIYSVLGDTLKYYFDYINNTWEFINAPTIDYSQYNSYSLNTASINVSLFITDQYNNIGIFNSIAQEWVAGKIYNVGDILIFNNNTYILMSGNSIIDNTYSGVYSEIEDTYYFDEYNADFTSGFFTSYIMNGNDYTHWIRNIRNDADGSNNNILVNKTDIMIASARTDSKLSSLAAYQGGGSILTFMDPNGYYKIGLKLNLNTATNNNGNTIYYYSYITNITETISSDLSTATDIYTYLIDAQYDINGDIPNTGIQYTDTYIGYLESGTTNYILSSTNTVTYDSLNNYTANITLGNALYNTLSLPINTNLNYEQFSDENTFNLSKINKIEYLMGIIDNPNINNTLFIDRGNNAAWENHLKLNEIRTLDQLVTYGNGFFNII
jgi:hypothetical protein